MVIKCVSVCVCVCVCRSADVPTRQRYVRLVEAVKDGGGTVRVFSSLHVSGERMYNAHSLYFTLCDYLYHCCIMLKLLVMTNLADHEDINAVKCIHNNNYYYKRVFVV